MSRSKRNAAASIIALVLAQSVLAPAAMAQSFQSQLENEPRLMFYLSKGFGNSRTLEDAPKLGLRLERSYRLDDRQFRIDQPTFEPTQQRMFNQPLIDLRWTGGYGQSLSFFGAPVYRTEFRANSSDVKGGNPKSDSLGSGEGSLSGIGESSGGYGWAVLIALVGGAALCAAEVVICEDSGYSRGRETDTTPGNDT